MIQSQDEQLSIQGTYSENTKYDTILNTEYTKQPQTVNRKKLRTNVVNKTESQERERNALTGRNLSMPTEDERKRERIRPPEFIVNPEILFLHDRLGRESRVKALCKQIAAEHEAAVVAVDGAFGSGKSVFLKMCAAYLRSQEIVVVEFNAWQQSHTGIPLVDLVSAVTPSALTDNPKLSKRIKKLAAQLANVTKRSGVRLFWDRISKLTLGLPQREDFRKSKESLFLSEWKATERHRKEFHNALAEAVTEAKDAQKIVVFIDELDRCLPMKALTLLDAVRHLFDVPGVMVVLGINQKELEHRVKTIFGEHCDASTYLRRFVDLTITLNNPKSTRLEEFLNRAFDNAQIPRSTDIPDAKIRMLGWLIELHAKRLEIRAMSLRDIEQLIHHIARVFKVLKLPGSNLMSPKTVSAHTFEDQRLAWEIAVLTMAVLRSIDTSAYKQLLAGRGKRLYTMDHMIRAFPIEEHQDKSFLSTSDSHAVSFLVPYLCGCMDMGYDSKGFGTGFAEDFTARFIRNKIGDETLAQDILEKWSLVEHVYTSEEFSTRTLSDLIEFAG